MFTKGKKTVMNTADIYFLENTMSCKYMDTSTIKTAGAIPYYINQMPSFFVGAAFTLLRAPIL